MATRAHLHSVADGSEALKVDARAAIKALRCKRPDCQQEVVSRGLGRPAVFCSARCRRLFHDEQRVVAAALRDQLRLARQYEIDTAELVPGDQPDASPRPESDRAGSILSGLLLDLCTVRADWERTGGRLHGDGEVLSRLLRIIDDALIEYRGRSS